MRLFNPAKRIRQARTHPTDARWLDLTLTVHGLCAVAVLYVRSHVRPVRRLKARGISRWPESDQSAKNRCVETEFPPLCYEPLDWRTIVAPTRGAIQVVRTVGSEPRFNHDL